MLVFKRKRGQRIVIDGKIVITIVETGDHSVKVGIEAPPDVVVNREEVERRIAHER